VAEKVPKNVCEEEHEEENSKCNFYTNVDSKYQIFLFRMMFRKTEIK
jgi:hypothetical protein